MSTSPEPATLLSDAIVQQLEGTKRPRALLIPSLSLA